MDEFIEEKAVVLQYLFLNDFVFIIVYVQDCGDCDVYIQKCVNWVTCY